LNSVWTLRVCCSTFRIDQCASSIHEPHERRIPEVLRPFCTQVFLDDILIYSKNEREHEEHLQVVLCCLRENKLYGKLSKCTFFQKEIHYLGHIISDEGISVDLEKVKAIMEWPMPKKIKHGCISSLLEANQTFLLPVVCPFCWKNP
jgi:hypothetical protein